MVALKALGWGLALAIAGFGLGWVYVAFFSGDSRAAMEGVVPIAVGTFTGLTIGVLAPLVAAAGEQSEPTDEGRVLAAALVAPPVVLAIIGGALYASGLGIDMVPAALITGGIGGVATGLAWGSARRRGLRVTPEGAALTFVPMLLIAWLAGASLDFSTSDESSFGPEVFFYMAMVLPLQLAAPVSAALRRSPAQASAT